MDAAGKNRTSPICTSVELRVLWVTEQSPAKSSRWCCYCYRWCCLPPTATAAGAAGAGGLPLLVLLVAAAYRCWPAYWPTAYRWPLLAGGVAAAGGRAAAGGGAGRRGGAAAGEVAEWTPLPRESSRMSYHCRGMGRSPMFALRRQTGLLKKLTDLVGRPSFDSCRRWYARPACR